MKSWQLDRRVGALSEKLKPVASDVVRLDFDSFSEPEKQLFREIWKIQDKYGSSPPADVLDANADLIFKAREVVGWRVLELFMFVMKEMLGNDEVEEWFFKLHFYNFLEDLKDCLGNVRKWSEKDREEFLRDMKESGMIDKVFRIPRGLFAEDVKKRAQMGYGAIALKSAAKTLSMTLKMAKVAHENNIPCFLADLTCTPTLVDWNKNVAARLAPFPGLKEIGLLESNGHHNYLRWQELISYHSCPEGSWIKSSEGMFELNNDFYQQSGGILQPSEHYLGLFK